MDRGRRDLGGVHLLLAGDRPSALARDQPARLPDAAGRLPHSGRFRRRAEPARRPGLLQARSEDQPVSEPERRGVAWTEERGTSDEGRRRLKAPRRRARQTECEPERRGVAWTEERGTSDEGRRRLKAPRRRARQTECEPERRGVAWTEERGTSDEG